jgi:hypothetical protein
MQESDKRPKFNHDLLIHPSDLATAQELYPGLVDALYDPELITYFKQFDDRAIDAKRKSRKLGTLAILLGAAAIALAAIDVAIRVFRQDDTPILLLVGAIAAGCGLYSAALGARGILFGPRKYEWLLNRFMGERIRQFHFQSLIAQLPLILAMAPAAEEAHADAAVRSKAGTPNKGDNPMAVDAARIKFLEDRHRRFVAFKAAFDELGREAKFGVTVSQGGETGWSICNAQDVPLVPGTEAALPNFFRAYREIRLQHQVDFANYKLTSEPKLFSDMPQRQAELLADVSRFSIQFVIVVHLCVVLIIVTSLLFSFQSGATTAVTGIFAFAIIALALVSLCAHAFAQGLQPEREVERYQQYGSAVNSILTDFNATKDPVEKLRIMRQMERTAFMEMRNFLITHHERSSFTM